MTMPTKSTLELLERIAIAQEQANAKLDILIEFVKYMSDTVNANTKEVARMQREAISAAPVGQPPPPPKQEACEQFVAATISYEFTQGKAVYRAKGGRYMKFGVPIYPEMLPQLGLSQEQLKFGENPFGKSVLALLKGEKAVKVVGLGQ